MNKFIDLVLKEKRMVLAVCFIIMFFGFLSYYYLPRQENPDVTSPAAVISAVFPGASAADVESLVVKKFEEEASKLEGIEKIDSISNDNFGAVIVTINYSVDKEKQWTDLKKYIDNLADKLPEGCSQPVIDTESMVETSGMMLSVTGDKYNYDQLEHYAEILKSNLINLDGISKVSLAGNVNKKIYVEVDIPKLNTYSLSIEDIYNLFRAQNLEIPSGSIKTSSGKINVKVPGSFESIEDIENLIITASNTGAVVRLKDIADVYFGETEDAKKIYNNGKNAVIASAYFKSGKNIVLMGDEISQAIEKTQKSIPDDVDIYKITYQPYDVSKSVNDFVINLFQGIIFVIAVVLIGMGFRNAIIVSTALPLSIFTTFIIMFFMKIDLQQISIAGLIMAVGILVDNSIVVADAIQVRLNEGYSPNEAALKGTAESAVPIFTSTLTTIAAFATLFVLPGEAGEFVKSMPLVVMIALIASYVVAMFVVPVLGAIFFKPKPNGENYNTKTRLAFNKMLSVSMKYKKTSVISVFVFLLISLLVAVFVLPLEIFPFTDKDYLYIDISNQNKSDLESTRTIVKNIEELLSDENEITNITSAVGGYLPKFYLTSTTGTDSDAFAQMLLKFNLDKNSEFNKDKEGYMMHIQEKLNDNIIGADMTAKLLAITVPGADVEIFITGNDRNQLEQSASDLETELMKIDGIYNVMDSLSGKKQEYKIEIKNDAATLMGLTKYDIQRQINIALSGTKATIYRKDGKENDIYLKSNIKSIDDLKNFQIKSSVTGNKILLKQVSDISLSSAVPTITRYNEMPVAKITAEVKSGYSAQAIQSKIEKDIVPNLNKGLDVNVSYGGEKQTILKYLKGLGIAALISLAVIFIILMVQFTSAIQPLIIMMTVPLSIIGSIFGLWVFKQPFSFTSGLGLAALIGIVVNNAILLIEYINRARKDGMTIDEACRNSVSRRIRPIMLSTVTTVVGLIPLAMSGSSFFTPMSITLMTGLMISTFFTLIIIPTLYSLIIKE